MPSSYKNFKLVRKNMLCFEMKDSNGNQFSVFKNKGYSSYYYYDDDDEDSYYIESKDINIHIDNELQVIAYQLDLSCDLKNPGHDWFYIDRSYIAHSRPDFSYVDAVLEDLKTATNPNYIGNYCTFLIIELMKMAKSEAAFYAKKIIPYLSYTRNLYSEYFNNIINTFSSISVLPKEMLPDFYFKLALSNVTREEAPDLFDNCEYYLKLAVDEKRTDLKDVLLRFPVIEKNSANAEFILETYQGIGINPKSLPAYLINKNRGDLLFSLLLEQPQYFEEPLKNATFFAIELIRYLALHGFSSSIAELAKSLIAYTKSPKDYFALRVFVSDDDLVESFKKKRQFNNNILDYSIPYNVESNDLVKKIIDATFPSSSIHLYNYKLEFSKYAFGYDNHGEVDIDDAKGIRSYVRNDINNKKPSSEFADKTLALINAGDKNILRYLFAPEAEETYSGDPIYALFKADCNLKLGKKVPDMHVYPEGK